MDPKTIAYITYLSIMLLNGFVLGTTGIGLNTWQYWVIIFGLAGCYLCGCVTGD